MKRNTLHLVFYISNRGLEFMARVRVEIVGVDKITKEDSHEGGRCTQERSLMEIPPTGCEKQWAKPRKLKDKPGK